MGAGDDVISVTSTSCAFAFTIVGLRLYTRIHLLKRLGTEDYLALTALVSGIWFGQKAAVGICCPASAQSALIVKATAKHGHRYVL